MTEVYNISIYEETLICSYTDLYIRFNLFVVLNRVSLTPLWRMRTLWSQSETTEFVGNGAPHNSIESSSCSSSNCHRYIYKIDTHMGATKWTKNAILYYIYMIHIYIYDTYIYDTYWCINIKNTHINTYIYTIIYTYNMYIYINMCISHDTALNSHSIVGSCCGSTGGRPWPSSGLRRRCARENHGNGMVL